MSEEKIKKFKDEFCYIQSQTGIEKILVKIFSNKSLKPAKYTVIFLHDYFSYHKYYVDVAQSLVKEFDELEVILFDFKGLGRSSGDRGYIKDWKEYPLEVTQIIEKFCKKDTEVFLVGCGVGGVVALDLLLGAEYQERVQLKGVALINPLLKMKLNYPRWSTRIIRSFPSFLERARFPIRFNYHRFCNDYAHAQKVNADALIPHDISLRSIVELVNANNRLKSLSYFIKKPILIMLSEKGHLCHNDYIRIYAKGIEKKQMSLIEYSGAYHDLLHDMKSQKVKKDLILWLKKQFSISSSLI